MINHVSVLREGDASSAMSIEKIHELMEELQHFKTQAATLADKLAILTAELERYNRLMRYPPGHFYSPVPDGEEIRAQDEKLFKTIADRIPAIELNAEGQLALLEAIKPYYVDLPFTDEPQPHLRYYFSNDFYEQSDGIFLYCMIRHLKPQRIIEVGSGFSSALMLDTNERFFNNAIQCTFIEPYPDRLLKLLRPEDQGHAVLIQKKLQAVDLDLFKSLAANDILFIDSSHTLKTGSDVNCILFEILPLLEKGVYVHFHDIFYPFEYPSHWVYGGMAWNECYGLRAFLQYNQAFQIRLFSTYLYQFHQAAYISDMPLCQKNPGGSIWLEKMVSPSP